MEFFRMSSQQMELVLDFVGPLISKQYRIRESIDAKQRLTFCLDNYCHMPQTKASNGSEKDTIYMLLPHPRPNQNTDFFSISNVKGNYG